MNRDDCINISVRELVEFAYLSGDLDSRFSGMSRAHEGASIHRRLQKLNIDRAASKGESYQKEVSIALKVDYKDLIINISGRIDGIIEKGQGVILDEIKTVQYSPDLITEDTYPVHWAQIKCYGYMYAVERHMDTVNMQITYISTEEDIIHIISKTCTFSELEKFFYDILKEYYVWAEMMYEWRLKRDESIKKLAFPYKEYRKNQRRLAIDIYKTIEEKKRIFIQAPTGTGKTISALFPAMKALGEGKTTKLFYITAKTITRQAALDALYVMEEKGLLCKAIVITAKDKICFKGESNCNPEFCVFAKSYYDKVKSVIKEIFKSHGIITRNIVEDYARAHEVCPFELSLDLSLYMDCIICDYNYVFDPRASLKRYFDERHKDFVLLVDEAHNLVDRAREMFSAELYKKPFLYVKRAMKSKASYISKTAAQINAFMLLLKKKSTGKSCCLDKSELEDLYPMLRELLLQLDEWLSKNQDSEEYRPILDLYFNVLAFQRISDLYDEGYTYYIENQKNDAVLRLFCLDPSKLLKQISDKVGAAIFFSATLTPLHFFKNILGGSPEDYTVRFPSPFKKENLFLAVADDVSTKYTQRDRSTGDIVRYIKAAAEGRPGNYLVFFPSYKYMNSVYEQFSSLYPEIEVIIQQPFMRESEKEQFLQYFVQTSGKMLIGFAVMGGMFSEGIDLAGDRLLGVIVVGVGLPQVCFERDIIMEYFSKKNSRGFEYAYMYPGMNKVLQASGRVIRSEDDKGIVLLIDERFSSKKYTDLFPEEWEHSIRAGNPESLGERVKEFWK